MTKRLFILSLVFVLAFGSLAACGFGKDEAAPQEETKETEGAEGTEETTEGVVPEEGASLLVWEAEGPEGKDLTRIAEAFTAKYGIPVQVEAVGHTEAVPKLVTDGPAGLGADVFAAAHDQLGNAVASGLVLENDLFADEIKNNFLPAAVQGVSYEEVVYGYPTAIETYALFYNKDLMPNPPATYEELIAFSKDFNNQDEQKYGFMWRVDDFYFSYSFLSGTGGYVFGDNGSNPEDIGLNSEGAVEGLTFMKSLKEILPLNTADVGYDAMTGLFNEGKLAAHINGPWNVAGARDAGVNFGVAPLPTLPNGEHPKSFSGIRALYVNSYTKYPNAAKLFAQFAVSKENLAERFTNTGQLPPRQDLLDDAAVANDPVAQAFLTQAQYAEPMPSIPQMGSVWPAIAAALATTWNDNTDPKTALDNAVQQIKDAIAGQ
jgi:arabinogalactan oligomer/maltooligosaccharide transport system substrate-binding protein